MKGKGPSPNRSSTGEREVLRLCTSPLFMAPWIQQHTFSWPGAKQGAIPIQKLTAESLLTRFTTLCLCPICPIWVGVCVSSAFVLGRCTYLYWLIEWKKLIRATLPLTESTQQQSLYLLPRTGKQKNRARLTCFIPSWTVVAWPRVLQRPALEHEWNA